MPLEVWSGKAVPSEHEHPYPPTHCGTLVASGAGGCSKRLRHPKRATLRRRSAAASSVSCFLAKQKRTRCAPKAGCEKKLEPGTAATPISSTKCRQKATSSGKPKLEMSHMM